MREHGLRLLGADDPAPVHQARSDGRSPYVFICDHAGRMIPRALGDLGLAQPDLDRHIAWDIGAFALSSALAERHGAPLVAQRYSRLVIDCNRDPQSREAIPQIVDGTTIPGNQDLPPAEVEARRFEIHGAYHGAIANLIDQRLARSLETIPVFVHSFTPALAGAVRPWRVGVLHTGECPFALRVLSALRAELGREAGDNEPYRFDATDYSAPAHALSRGLPFLELEIRQDLLLTAPGVDEVAKLISKILAAAGPVRP
jgi:predicted N-formylglutamate amidohydrolase